MRTAHRFLSSTLLILALLLVGVFPVRADILEDAKAKRAVEAQRVERLVSDAQVKALSLQKTRPAEALEALKSALTVLDADQTLEAKRRTDLIVSLKKWAHELEGTAPGTGTGAPPRYGVNDLKRAEAERQQSEAESINRMQSQIRAAQQAGNSREANRLQDELSRRFPSNPAIQAGTILGNRSEAVNARAPLSQKRNEGMLLVGQSIEKSALVPADDVAFPPDWKEKSKRRSAAMQITDKERAILRALGTVTSVEFKDATLEEVISWLQKAMGVQIVIDPQGMRDAGVDYKTPISVTMRGSYRSILRKILGEANLAYIMKDEAIQVTSMPRARETMSVRNYYIGDLVAASTMQYGPFFANLQSAIQLQQLAVLITQTLEPQSWLVNGGLGTIAFNPISMSFLVRQTAEMHYVMGASMR